MVLKSYFCVPASQTAMLNLNTFFLISQNLEIYSVHTLITKFASQISIP